MDEKINKIIQGDCLIKLKELEDNSVDSIVTDPPYHLVSIVKRFGKEGSAPAKEGTDVSFKRLSGGFMGKQWDGVNENGIGIAQNPELWKECLRVLKPGGHLLAFSGTRTYHRMASAIEDAGFEVRDMIEWVYGSGFPKSLNIGKAVARIQGENIPKTKGFNVAGQGIGLNPNKELRSDHPNYVKPKFENDFDGWGTALKPAHEPICMARKPLSEKTVAENCLKWGTGGINIDESRVGTEIRENPQYGNGGDLLAVSKGGEQKWDGTKETVSGRFPANLIHDNSEEVRECFPEVKGATSRTNGKAENGFLAGENETFAGNIYKDNETNASRFFKSIIYQAKASKSERNRGCEGLENKPSQLNSGGIGRECSVEKRLEENGENAPTMKNNHPTVKPIALMEYLIKMITPKGGIVLDPFAGSGSTLVAAKENGYQYIGIEMTEEYIPIIEARLSAVNQKLI